MATQKVIWCDSCKEQQFGGNPVFELEITYKQIGNRSAWANNHVLHFCSYNGCYDRFVDGIDKLLSRLDVGTAPRIRLEFKK